MTANRKRRELVLWAAWLPAGASLASCGLLEPPALAPKVGAQPLPAAPTPIVSVDQWGGLPTPQPAVAQVLRQLTVHHQGEFWAPDGDVPAYLRRLQSWSRTARNWVDIPYHYVVAPSGVVYAARPVAIAGDTNTAYKPEGHLLVMLLGNFEVQQPTAAQWQGTVRLVARLLLEHRLPSHSISAHRDHTSQTVCPGANRYKRLDELRAAVAAAHTAATAAAAAGQ